MGVERARYKPPSTKWTSSCKVGVRQYPCSVVYMPYTGKESFVSPPSFTNQADFVLHLCKVECLEGTSIDNIRAIDFILELKSRLYIDLYIFTFHCHMGVPCQRVRTTRQSSSLACIYA
jgi:hypothetical protein